MPEDQTITVEPTRTNAEMFAGNYADGYYIVKPDGYSAKQIVRIERDYGSAIIHFFHWPRMSPTAFMEQYPHAQWGPRIQI